MTVEITNIRPFEITKTRTQLLALVVIAFGLLLLVVSNITSLQQAKFLGGSVVSLLSNLGFAAVTLASFQMLYDSQQREVFFREIRNEIAGNESVRRAGIALVVPDSKRLDFSQLVRQSDIIEVGVAYSDRFVKDYLSILEKRPNLKLIYYMADTSSDDLVSALSFMTRKEKNHVITSALNLEDFLKQISISGTRVEIIKVKSISHYSFVRFNKKRSFLNLSTFSSRRADVPSLDIAHDGFVQSFIEDDINNLRESLPCQPTSKRSSRSFFASILPQLSLKK